MAMPHDLSLESLGYTPHCLTETTADTTVALLLVTARRVGEAMAAVAQTPLSSSTHPLKHLFLLPHIRLILFLLPFLYPYLLSLSAKKLIP